MCIHMVADALAAPALDLIDSIHTGIDALAVPAQGTIDPVHQAPNRKAEVPFPAKGPPEVLHHIVWTQPIDLTTRSCRLTGLHMGFYRRPQAPVLHRP